MTADTERDRLILLRYELLRARFRAVRPQHGHRGNRLTIAAMSLRRMVAIEFGMCRSGRKGGSSGSVTVGYGKLREQSGGTRTFGGTPSPLPGQESPRCKPHPRRVIENPPTPAPQNTHRAPPPSTPPPPPA